MSIRSLLRTAALIPVIASFAYSQDQVQTQPNGSGAPDGMAIFLQRCAKCHGERGQGISAEVTIAGPSLQGEHDHGLAMMAMQVGPSHMPSFARVLTIPEMHAVADYVTQQLAVIPLSGGDLSQGGDLFRTYCAPCHRTAARGGALVFTGTNAPALTNYSRGLIAGAIRWGPGPMPAFPASVLNDTQVASIVDYVELAKHPPNPGGNTLNWYGPVAEGFAAWVIVFALAGLTGWIEKGGKG
ncbi:MAG TPA: c-type cytochrome [Dongiaceae bacterium]|nr:c-type cytochrome [Dongiaceae bacterium]